MLVMSWLYMQVCWSLPIKSPVDSILVDDGFSLTRLVSTPKACTSLAAFEVHATRTEDQSNCPISSDTITHFYNIVGFFLHFFYDDLICSVSDSTKDHL